MLSIVSHALLRPDEMIIIPFNDEFFLMVIDKWVGLFTETGRCLRIYTGHDSFISCLTTYRNAEGRTIIVASNSYGRLLRWDAETGAVVGKILQASKPNFYIFCCTYRALDGRMIIMLVNHYGRVERWEANTGIPIEQLIQTEGEFITGCAIYQHTDKRTIMIASRADGTVLRWDTETGALIDELINEDHAQMTCCATYQDINKNTIIVAGSDNGRLLRWHAASGRQLTSLQTDDHTIDCCTTYQDANDQTIIVTGGREGRLLRWDAETGALLSDPSCRLLKRWSSVINDHVDTPLRGHFYKVSCCTIYQALNQANVLISSSIDGDICRWDANTLEPINILVGRNNSAKLMNNAIYRRKDGRVIAISQQGRQVLHYYDLETSTDRGPLAGQQEQKAIFYLVYTTVNAETCIVAIHEDNNLRRWNGETGELISQLPLAPDIIKYFKENYSYITYRDKNHNTIILLCNSGNILQQLSSETLAPIYPPLIIDGPSCRCFTTYQDSNNNTIIVAFNYQGRLMRWNAKTGTLISIIDTRYEINYCTTYSMRDSTTILLAAAQGIGLLRLNAETGALIDILPSLEQYLICFCTTYHISPTKTLILTVDAKERLCQWDAATKELLKVDYLPYGIESCNRFDNTCYLRLAADNGYLLLQPMP